MTDYKAVKIIRNGCEYCFASGARYADILVVGGGGNGNGGNMGGGGGGGGIIHKIHYGIDFLDENNTACVVVGGAHADSCLGCLKACRGGSGGEAGGSGGGANGASYCTIGGASAYSYDLLFQGSNGGRSCNDGCAASGHNNRGGGGGGAGGAGGEGTARGGGNGGSGCQYDITGECCYYSAGGGAGASGWNRGYIPRPSGGTGGGGAGGTSDSCCGCQYNATAPTSYGSGGGGGHGATCGCQGIVVIRYHTDGSDGIHCATGGCVYTCGDYTIHCFTSSGCFCVIK